MIVYISFIDRYEPEYVIILSGDQICKQDYSEFLAFAKEKNADFNSKITEFQEKSKNPRSNLASMGIHIFKWDILRKYLIEDEMDPNQRTIFFVLSKVRSGENGNDMRLMH